MVLSVLSLGHLRRQWLLRLGGSVCHDGGYSGLCGVCVSCSDVGRTIGLVVAAVVAAASAVVALVAAFSAAVWAVASRVEAAWSAVSWVASILSVFPLCVNARGFTRGGGVFVSSWRECCYPLREQWRAKKCRCLSGVTLCVSCGEHTRGVGVRRELPSCVRRLPWTVSAVEGVCWFSLCGVWDSPLL